MSKFKVGDEVVGIGDNYYITREGNGWGVVERVFRKGSRGDDDMEVIWFLPSGKQESKIPYSVESKYFELKTRKSKLKTRKGR